MMRLPNSYGTVYKLSGKRRRPWIARRPVGKKRDDSRRVVRVEYETIGYFEKRSEALEALAVASRKPIRKGKPLTLAEIYAKWSAQKFQKLRVTGHYTAAYAVLEPLHERPFEELTLPEVQDVFDHSGKNAPTLANARLILSQLNEYAIVNELIPDRRNIFSHLDIGENPNRIPRSVFTREEISALWRDHEEQWKAATLVLLYSGLRVGELLNLRVGDVEDGVIHVRQAKTAAGVRDVPVAECIRPILEEYTTSARNYIFTIQYKTFLNHMMDETGHRPHDTRHTFTTRLAEKGVDQRVIETIVGHKANNLTFDVYTHIGIEEMRKAVDLLEVC